MDSIGFERSVGSTRSSQKLLDLAKSLEECTESFSKTKRLEVTVLGMHFIHPS